MSQTDTIQTEDIKFEIGIKRAHDALEEAWTELVYASNNTDSVSQEIMVDQWKVRAMQLYKDMTDEAISCNATISKRCNK